MEKHEHGSISATDIHPVLAEIPPKLWAKHKYDVGLIKGCEPVVITPKSDYRLCPSQCPLKKEALRGIQPVFESLLKERVIIPCHDSPVRTPIFPVKKITSNTSEPVTWRFVQDLQAVNSAVIARAARVPNPYTILSQIPQNAMYFTVVDLANAFFSVPVEEKSQFWFAFDFDNKGYTFTRLCQGYCESPTIYNEALRRSLEPLTLSSGTALLQYIDYLLICARDEVTCVADNVTLLNHLAREGHKVSLTKLQFCAAGNNFFWVTLTLNSKSYLWETDKSYQRCTKTFNKDNCYHSWECVHIVERLFQIMHFLKSPWEPWQQGKGWGHVTRLKGFFYTDGRRSLHDFARAKNITFINSPMAEVSHDFTWHAKCNSEKMHNFESCHTPPDGGGWTGTPLLSISRDRCVHHVQTCWTHL